MTGAFFLASPVGAQNVNLSMTPPIIELTIKPEKSVVIAYAISNLGDPAVLSSFVRPFVPTGVYGAFTIAEEFSGPIRFNLENSNIQLDTPFFLKTHQGQQLLLKIRVAEGTPEGDYYYTFLVKNEPGKRVEGSTEPLTQAAIGSNILISVTGSGTFDSQPRISQFKVEPRYHIPFFGKYINLFESSDPIPVRLIVENKGKNLIKPDGSINLKGTFGESMNYDILPENILSNSSRLLHATPSGYLRNQKNSLVINGFHIGKYVLTSAVSFGSNEQTLRNSVIFYAVPLKLLIATGVAIIIGFLIIKRFSSTEEETTA